MKMTSKSDFQEGKMRKKRLGLIGVTAAAVVLGAGGIAIAASEGDGGLGKSSSQGDQRALTVQATTAAAPAPEAAPNADTRTNARKGLPSPPSIALQMSGLRTPDSTARPDWLKQATDVPGVDGKGARQFQGVAGTSPLWLVPNGNSPAVLLVSKEWTSGFAAWSLEEGKLLRVNEMLEGDPSGVAVSGFLPDGTTDTRIVTNSGEQTFELRDSFYSVRFDKKPDALPRKLRWTDAKGEHEVSIPISPDLR